MKHTFALVLATLALLGAGCQGSSSNTVSTSTSSTPIVQQPTNTQPSNNQPTNSPPSAPAPEQRTPLSDIRVTGAFTYTGKLLMGCSPANPIKDPYRQPPTGWQMRGWTTEPDSNGVSLRFNIHNGNEKRDGAQTVAGPFDGKTSVALEYSAGENQPWQSFFGTAGKPSVTFSDNQQTATVVGELEDALGQGTVQVNATVKCQ